MLNQLLDIITHSFGARPGPLELGTPSAPSTPFEVLCAARRICQAAALHRPGEEAPHSVWREVGVSLVRFLASPNAALDRSLERLATIPPEPPRAWDEPRSDEYACLCALVNEVWEHCIQRDDGLELLCIDSIERRGGARIYDFGAGSGALAILLAGSGLAVTCYEPNPIKRLFLAARVEALGLGDSLQIGVGTPATYDTLLALDVLDHVESPAEAVQHLASVLLPGGALITTAAFPDDGWHGGPSEAVAAEAALLRYFEPDREASRAFPGMEWLRNGRRCEPCNLT